MRRLVQDFQSPLALGIAFLAGGIASAINAFAGGGSLISFPTLLWLGLPDINANATNSVALWPGSAAGAFGYRKYFAKTKHLLIKLIWPTILGSTLGAYLLVLTSEEAFQAIVPFLVLVAVLLLAFQNKIKEMASKRNLHAGVWTGIILQFLVSLYGGYFGAGMGIMMLGIMSLFVDGDMNELNALKNWLAVIINFGASVILIMQGLVLLLPAIALMAGALIGGYFSAYFTQRVPSETLRKVIVVYGLLMSLWFFYRGFIQ